MRLLRSSGRALRGFILRANFSRARMSFASRYSIPSSEPRAGLFIARVTNAASYSGGVACGKGKLTIHQATMGLPAIRAAEKDPSQSPAQAAQDQEGNKREHQHQHYHYCHACRIFKVIEHGH